MALFPKFPYLNFHELNLDWIIEQVKANKEKIESLEGATDVITFMAKNNITVTSSGWFNAPLTCNKSPKEVYDAIASGDPVQMIYKLSCRNGVFVIPVMATTVELESGYQINGECVYYTLEELTVTKHTMLMRILVGEDYFTSRVKLAEED